MKKVVLITTGECERAGLVPSLRRYFPSAEFTSPIIRDSFTSARLKLVPRTGGTRPSQVDRLAAAMVAATDPGRTGERPDLVIAVDDVELPNLDQVDVVVGQLREAVKHHLETYAWPSARRQEQVVQRLREHCSFHLLCPMVEAYFYGEPGALTRAGAQRPSTVDARALDVEDFITHEPPFLEVPDKAKYWATPDRQRHPKRYLQYLCDPEGDEQNPNPHRYRETHGGVKALRELDWSGALSQESHARLARSLFADLSEALEVDNPFPGTCHPETSSPGAEAVLRNL
ncbi:MAG TPA: hypothetical protein VFZ09_40485 [Archangium sp.]|uniref:hypothetical protein n=1 Tax=Archangium sp. TaxID=1872627 RepID=UPI002E35B195|nr:hypothetical protein [Archangium sp.]HEX5752553.1 hypothetical protein [Archangium sp.]